MSKQELEKYLQSVSNDAETKLTELTEAELQQVAGGLTVTTDDSRFANATWEKSF